MLALTRPLAFIDLETTGLAVGRDRIVEFAILKLSPDGSRAVKKSRVNPEMPISEESTSIHGITNADVANEPTFGQLAPSLYKFLFDCDLAGYNSNKFDIPMLVEEFLRAGIEFDYSSRHFVDVQNIFHKMEQRTLAAAYKFYCQKELEGAHGALADIEATAEVFESQLKRYEGQLKPDVAFLAEFSRNHKAADLMGRLVFNDQNEVVFNFGKHKGVPVVKVFEKEPGYYGWLMGGDFPQSTKVVFKSLFEQHKQGKKESTS